MVKVLLAAKVKVDTTEKVRPRGRESRKGAEREDYDQRQVRLGKLFFLT